MNKYLIYISIILLIISQKNIADNTFDSPQVLEYNTTIKFFNTNNQLITQIKAAIADTPSARIIGLMHQTYLAKNEGMLFVYNTIEKRSFWMKNTPLPLDILFIDEHFQIINIAQQTEPMSEQHYASTKPAHYVIEVHSGFTEKFNIQPNHYVRW